MKAPHKMLIVSGANGTGKTTIALACAQQFGYTYIGADDIAAKLAPDDPASQQIQAGRQFVWYVSKAIERKQSVVIESTLSGRTFARTIKDARDAGFAISLVHLFLDSADTCVARVDERVQKGGHSVPDRDIRRRFTRSAANFWRLYRPLCDRWILMYNSTTDAQPVAGGDSETHTVQDKTLFDTFMHIVQAND